MTTEDRLNIQREYDNDEDGWENISEEEANAIGGIWTPWAVYRIENEAQ